MKFPVSVCLRNEALQSGKWYPDANTPEELEARKRDFVAKHYRRFVVLIARDSRNVETEIARGDS